MKKTLTAKLGQISDYEIRLLKVFRAVVECGGFTAAETELSIGRSTISLHISKLEQRLGLKLCQRGRGGFHLTDDGKEVYGLMKELFSALESFRTGINALHVVLTGELKIIVSDGVCLDQRSHLVAAINRFSVMAPEVNILLDVKAMSEIERMVLNGEVDIGLIPDHQQLEGLNYLPIYSDPCHLYCSSLHPLFDEKDCPVLLQQVLESKVVHAGVHTNQLVGEQLADMNKAAISYFYEARLAMILSGAYIGFMPDGFVKDYVASGQLRILCGEDKYYDLGVIAITRQHGRSDRARDLFLGVLNELHGSPETGQNF